MNNKICTIISCLVILVSILIIPIGVNAASHYTNTSNYVADGSAVLLCEYKSDANDDGLRIYFHFQYVNDGNNNNIIRKQYGFWDVFTSKAGGKWSDIYNAWTKETLSYGSFLDVFTTSTRIHYNKLKGRLTNEDTFKCPQYGYLDYDILEVCLSENGNCDTSKFDRPQMTLLTTSDTIFNDINNYAAVDVYNDITSNEVLNSSNLESLSVQKTKQYIQNKYFSSGLYIFPQFLTNYINNLPNTLDTSKIPGAEEAYEEFLERINPEVEQAVEEETLTEDEAAVIINKIESKPWSSVKGDLGGGDFKDPEAETDCESLLTPSFAKVLNNILKFIQYLGPVLVGIFTLVDFLKVAFSGDQEEIKKVSKKFMKRVIAAILLVMIPIIVNLIFRLTGVIPPQNCFN